MRVRSILGVSLFLSVVSVYAQQQPPQPQVPAQPNQPIELPEFIVTGKERVDIPGGAKQAPVRPPLLSASQSYTQTAPSAPSTATVAFAGTFLTVPSRLR